MVRLCWPTIVKVKSHTCLWDHIQALLKVWDQWQAHMQVWKHILLQVWKLVYAHLCPQFLPHHTKCKTIDGFFFIPEYIIRPETAPAPALPKKCRSCRCCINSSVLPWQCGGAIFTALQCYIVQCRLTLSSSVLCYTMQCSLVLHYPMPCNVTLSRAV